MGSCDVAGFVTAPRRSLSRYASGTPATATPALTTYPLGILLANEAISEDQHRAGYQYAWLHWRVFSRPSVAAARQALHCHIET